MTKNTTYTIRYTNGDRDGGYTSYAAAKAAVEARYPDAEIGHDGDLSEGGDRTLCWANAEDAENDDGARAIASIEERSR